jgi:hypothetical protein
MDKKEFLKELDGRGFDFQDKSYTEFGFNDEILNMVYEMYCAGQQAQAVPEVKPSHTVTLTCAQLLEAFRFGAPDEDNPEQLKTEMTITWSDVGHSGKGYYCYYSELPEEGAIFLDEEGDAQEPT